MRKRWRPARSGRHGRGRWRYTLTIRSRRCSGREPWGWSSRSKTPGVDSLLVAVGGGGLIGGIAAWYAGRVRIIGVEPEAAPTLAMALEAGHPVDAPAGGIAADSLAPKRVGELMFPIAQKYIDQVVLVPDDAIEAAQNS